MNAGSLIKISFLGDLMCLKEQNEAFLLSENKGKDYYEIFENVRSLIEPSDYVIGNLETPISDDALSNESICFNTPSEFLVGIKKLGINFLTTANNHCLDRGIKGLEETINNIDKLEIQHTGTYNSREKSEEISTFKIRNTTFAVLSSTYGTNSEENGFILPEEELWRVDLFKKQNKLRKFKFDSEGGMGKKYISDCVTPVAITNEQNKLLLERFLVKINKAKDLADIVIVMPHIGGQYNFYPGIYTSYVINEISKLSPSIIVAGHPHVPQHCDSINGIFTCFSLGNFSCTPNVGYFVPNVLSEYGIIMHTYWDDINKSLKKVSFSIIKNVTGDDNITRVWPVHKLNSSLKGIEKERLSIDVNSISNRVACRLVKNPFEEEIDITPPPIK